MRHGDWMRRCLGVLLFGLGACVASPLPPGAATSPPPDLLDAGTRGKDLSHSDLGGRRHHDLAMTVDLAQASDGASMSMCGTACDCPSGQACLQGTCTTIPDFQIYCCDSATQCPMGQACEDSQGDVGLCGGPTLPIPISQLCGFIPCQDSSICSLVGCGDCNNGTCGPASSGNPPPPR